MKTIREDVLKLTVPILVEQMFVMSMGTINTMMAGHIGKEAVSAIGMVDSINNIFIAFFSALAVGGTVVVAQYTGQRNVKKANEATKQALYSSLAISLAITIITWVFREPLISILYGSAEKEVINDAFIYLAITLLTYPAISISLVANGVLRGAGDSKTPMTITIVMNIMNVILSYLLIYGINIKNNFINIYIKGLGIEGAALGIAAARTIGALIVMLVLLRGSASLKLKGIFKFKMDKELLKSIFGIGVPASVESLLFNGGKLITQIYIVGMGTVSIASNAIAGSIISMLNIPGNALSIAATALVGQYMGRGNTEESGRVLSYMTKLSTICLAIIGVLSVPFANQIAMLYNKNADIVQLTADIIRINAIFMPLWSVSFVLPAGLKGAGDATYTMVTAVIGMWLFRITLGYFLGIPLKLGLIGVWMGMYIDWLVRGILYYKRLKNGKWKDHVVIRSV
ncbi:MATE family efflux transporter [Fonticella tunisiensis]|uniref:Probable multidrug resistance protein NorM n=1 Tax=Fonticella tunisiensis TaxID=1096341 RepID=A0A4R7KSN5_9CLOT|nr:MATE family efflux transporter [Fonticella tunisiensis]TDT61112.1 putative MATE family efflux protein [Fonticella tunisiensis]